MAKTKHFASDIATLVMGAGATLTLLTASGGMSKVAVHDFLWESDDMKGAILVSIEIPFLTAGQTLATYRTAQRPNNARESTLSTSLSCAAPNRGARAS